MTTFCSRLLCLSMMCWVSGAAWAETSVEPDGDEGWWESHHMWTFDTDGHAAAGITAAYEDRGLVALPIPLSPWTGEEPLAQGHERAERVSDQCG